MIRLATRTKLRRDSRLGKIQLIINKAKNGPKKNCTAKKWPIKCQNATSLWDIVIQLRILLHQPHAEGASSFGSSTSSPFEFSSKILWLFLSAILINLAPHVSAKASGKRVKFLGSRLVREWSAHIFYQPYFSFSKIPFQLFVCIGGLELVARLVLQNPNMQKHLDKRSGHFPGKICKHSFWEVYICT